MASITNTQVNERFSKAMELAIQNVVKEVVEEEVATANKRVEARIPEILTKIGLTVQQTMDAYNNEAVLQIRMRPTLQ